MQKLLLTLFVPALSMPNFLHIPHIEFTPDRFQAIRSVSTKSGSFMLPFPVVKLPEFENRIVRQPKIEDILFPINPKNELTERRYVLHLRNLVNYLEDHTNIDLEIYDPTYLG